MLAADAGATVDLESGDAIIRNLGATQAVTLRGLHGFVTGWQLEANAGTVWFEDCFLEFGGAFEPGTISAVDCANVVVTRCTILGLSAIPFLGIDFPAAAVTVDGCRLTLLESTLVGGSGDLSMTTEDVPGAEAVELIDSELFLGGSELSGGPGDTDPGGAALLVSGDSQAWLLDSVLGGGVGTPPGAPVVVSGHGAVTTLPGAEFSFEIDSPRRVGEPISLALQGPPGHSAWLLKSLLPGGLIKPGWSGVLLVEPASFVLTALGTIPPSGTLSFTGTVPSIAGLEALPLFVQGLSVASGSVALASGSHLLLLAPGL